MTDTATKFPSGGVTVGNNVATFSSTTDSASAVDLISAATNTTGITITAATISPYAIGGGSGRAGQTFVKLLIGGAVQLWANAGCSSLLDSGRGASALGGFCAISVPAGVAVSYILRIDNGSGLATGGADGNVVWKAN